MVGNFVIVDLDLTIFVSKSLEEANEIEKRTQEERLYGRGSRRRNDVSELARTTVFARGRHRSSCGFMRFCLGFLKTANCGSV